MQHHTRLDKGTTSFPASPFQNNTFEDGSVLRCFFFKSTFLNYWINESNQNGHLAREKEVEEQEKIRGEGAREASQACSGSRTSCS